MNLTQELNNNPLFNTVAQLTGTNHQEFAQAAIQGRVGYRFSAGLWLDPTASYGIEGSMLHLDRRPSTASVTPLDLNRLGSEAGAVGFSAITGGGGGTTVIPITAAGLLTGTVVFEVDDLVVDDYQLLGRARLIGDTLYISMASLAAGVFTSKSRWRFRPKRRRRGCRWSPARPCIRATESTRKRHTPAYFSDLTARRTGMAGTSVFDRRRPSRRCEMS